MRWLRPSDVAAWASSAWWAASTTVGLVGAVASEALVVPAQVLGDVADELMRRGA